MAEALEFSRETRDLCLEMVRSHKSMTMNSMSERKSNSSNFSESKTVSMRMTYVRLLEKYSKESDDKFRVISLSLRSA